MSPNFAQFRFDGDIMRYSTTPIVRSALMAVASATLLGACAPQRTAELAENESLIILEEIGIESSLVGYDQPSFEFDGPSLIAGDWLAIQCAQASGFFNLYEWTPVYANVVSSDFEFGVE